jgi:hypothetical protein
MNVGIEKIKEITNQFLGAITKSLKDMPYGLRCIGMFLRDILRKKFPGNDDEVTRMVGNLIYYRYLNPAIVYVDTCLTPRAPEAFDVIEANISPIQRKNLAEIAKVLHLSSLNQPFPMESIHSESFNKYLGSSYKTLLQFFNDVVNNILSPEEHFCVDGSFDLAAGTKISIYISPDEILQLHRNIIECVEDVAADKDDKIRTILTDLGTPPGAGAIQQKSEISLVLLNRFRESYEEGDTVKLKMKSNETKRQILAIIRIQSGKDLVAILELPVTKREETLYQELLVQEEERINERSLAAEKKKAMMGSTGSLTGSSNTLNLSVGGRAKSENCLSAPTKRELSSTYAELKLNAIKNLVILEEGGIVKRANQYQDMLNSIAKDMLNKHRRRSQRTREIQVLTSTLGNLDEKAKFLFDQITSYHDYIDACISQLGNKKGYVVSLLMYVKDRKETIAVYKAVLSHA